MLLAKLFLLSSLFFSYSVRTPATIDQNIYDYEYRLGCEGNINNYSNISYYLDGLYEREEGIKGSGHDIDIKIKDNVGIKDNPYPAIWHLSSYYRQVTDFSIQTLDAGIKIAPVWIIGVSIAGDISARMNLMFYGGYDNGWIEANLRSDNNTTIKDLRLKKEWKVKGSMFVEPQLVWKSINADKDYQGKLLFKFKFKKDK